MPRHIGPHPRRRCRALRYLAALAYATLAVPAYAVHPSGGDADLGIAHVIEDVRRGALGDALAEVDRLISRHPNFRLAHLVKGDVLSARVRALRALGDPDRRADERLEGLRAEATARVRARARPLPADRVPRYLLHSARESKHLVLVDAARSRVYVYAMRDGVPTRVRDFYATVGRAGTDKQREGDQRTPVGVYRVTGWIPGARLPDLYGGGAFPLDYPNPRDRLEGRTGYGIWLHGVPSDTYARAPFASDGCVALANPDLEALRALVRPGVTPVIIARDVEWVSPAALKADRDAFLSVFEAWRRDWERRDSVRYLAHYAPGFRSGSMDLARWRAHKQRVNAAKRWIRVGVEDFAAYRVPGAADVVSVSFTQDYRSDTLSQRTRKRQYWQRHEGRWAVIYEAPEGTPVQPLPASYPRGLRAAGTRTGGGSS